MGERALTGIWQQRPVVGAPSTQQTDIVASNIRFAWLTSADAGFYVVYCETRDDDVGLFTEKLREWILKFSHTFDVFN